MNTSIIDNAFAQLISKRAVHRDIKTNSNSIRSLRYKLKYGGRISLEHKIKLLQLSGWHQPADTFTKQDMFLFAKFWYRSSQATRDMGVEYALEKFQNRK